MKKRILSLVMVLTMLTTALLPSISVYAMTPQEGADWALAQIGKAIDHDGVYGAQCVDLIKRYCSVHWGWTPKGNAKEYATIALPNSSWTRIKNTADFIPQPGDIAIWTNGTYGHVAIIISANINNFVSVDQNWYNANGTVGSPAAKVPHNYSGFWGVIRPPFSSASTETTQPVHSGTSATVRDGFFTLKNASSGKYMNVYGGTDANKTAITMWAYDDSTDQQFNIVHKGNGKYKLYAVASSNGTNRVVDVYRNGAAPAAGQVVDLWTPDDDTAQLFYIVPLSDGSYVFELAAKDGYVIAPTSASAAGTNGSQLTLQKYTGASYQKWKFCNNNGKETYPVGSYSADSYTVDTNGVTLRMRSGAGTGYSQVTSIPDKTTLNITKVSSNWGYTTYNGYSGWVCLDFMVYSPTVTGISIQSKPHTLSYLVGDELDTTDMAVAVTYSNGSTKTIIDGFTTSYDFSSAGTKTVTVSYSGHSTSFTVEVVDAGTASLSISATEMVYYGDELAATLSLSDVKDIYDGSFNVKYDNTVFELMSSSVGNALTGHNPTLNTAYADNMVRLSFAGTSVLTEGEMLTLVFKVISDKTSSSTIEVTDLSLYNASGYAATTTSENMEITIAQRDYTITDLYMLDASDEPISAIPTSGSFYVGIGFNKNSIGTERPTVIFAVYDENDRAVASAYTQSTRYTQGDELNCEAEISLPQNCSAPSYIKAFIWDSFDGMIPLSNSYR